MRIVGGGLSFGRQRQQINHWKWEPMYEGSSLE